MTYTDGPLSGVYRPSTWHSPPARLTSRVISTRSTDPSATYAVHPPFFPQDRTRAWAVKEGRARGASLSCPQVSLMYIKTTSTPVEASLRTVSMTIWALVIPTDLFPTRTVAVVTVDRTKPLAFANRNPADRRGTSA